MNIYNQRDTVALATGLRGLSLALSSGEAFGGNEATKTLNEAADLIVNMRERHIEEQAELSSEIGRLNDLTEQQRSTINELGATLDCALENVEQLSTRNNLLDAANGGDSKMLQEILGLVKDIDERSRPVPGLGPR